MTVTFFSNYLNHHQLPFCLKMIEELGENFKFIATTPFNQERLKVGYMDMNHSYDFVIRSYEDEEQFQKAYDLAISSDVMILGSAPDSYLEDRLAHNKNAITFRYSERLFKETAGKVNYLNIGFAYMCIKNVLQRRKNYYLLAASAYAPIDYYRYGFGKDKYLKWGYFPEKSLEQLEEILSAKEDKIRLLWVGRLIDWKHPEQAIKIAQLLEKDGFDFEMRIIGDGPLKDNIVQMIEDMQLNHCVKYLGGLPSAITREEMKKSHVFLFTSDWNEGWGAVLNESMTSACAVIGSHAIGAVPFLIQDGVDGWIYKNENIEDLYEKVKMLVSDPILIRKTGTNAFEKIQTLWCAEEAADRIINISDAIMKGKEPLDIYNDGPCSRAQLIKENWR